MLPKLILTDIDGVWTDGGMYYDQSGNELKRFNTYDSAGVLFAKYLRIPIGIITGEDTFIVKRRANKLGVDYCYLGIKDKFKLVKSMCTELAISFKEIAFIGDDINDLKLLKAVGYSAAPSSAPEYIKSHVNYVTMKNGGEGAFREFVEFLLGKEIIEDIINNVYLENQ